MHGVPKDLDLSHFVGKTLIQLGIGEFQVQFNFHPHSNISVEDDWELYDSYGSVVDRSVPNDQRAEYRLHRLLGQEVVGWQIDPPRSFSLRFANDLVLRVFDNSRQHESFSIDGTYV